MKGPPKMNKTVCIVLCLATCLRTGAQSMEVSGSKVSLPEGNVLGAAFYEDKGIFFVQQSVLSAENGGLVIRSHRQLSSWNLKNLSMITRRVFDETPHGASAYPCGRVEISAKVHRVFLCSAGSHMEVIDPDTLGTLGTVAQAGDHYISDFAVDDLRGRLLVLASHRDGSISLTAYSLLNGDKQQEAVMPIKNGTRMSLAFAPTTGLIGIAVNVGHLGSRADIYACATDKTFSCANVT